MTVSHRLHLVPLPALSDNYIWLLHDGRQALVVDPGEAAPVLAALVQAGLQLGAIFITHHHADHTAGLAELKRASGAQVFGHVYGPAHERIAHVDVPLQHGQQAQALGLAWQVLDVPGHTAGHIAFFATVPDVHAPGGLASLDASDAAQAPQAGTIPILFCGDTLFGAGCGRLFEGTPAQMLASLDALAALPDATLVCCAHEYTLGNLAFAQALAAADAAMGADVGADNARLLLACQQAGQLRQAALPTLPTRLGLERRINPFLRSRHVTVRAALRQAGKAPAPQEDDAAWFAALREWKNQF